jgi:hypothetical protein
MNAATSKTMTKGTLLSGLFLSLALGVGVAHAAVKGSGMLAFHAKGPMGLKIDGKGPLSVSEEGGVIRLTSPLGKLDTGMDMRNDHMRKRMHADKHPTVSFAVERAKLTFPADGQEFSGKAVGTIELNGIPKKDASFSYKAKRTGTSYAVTGSLGMNVTRHGIKEDDLCEMGVCAKPDVVVEVKFTVTDSPATGT